MTLVIASFLVFDHIPGFGMQGKTAPPSVEFLRIARNELTSGSDLKEATAYLASLSPAHQLQVARAALYDADARIGYLSANILIEQGRAREAVPALASIIASGRNETQLNGRMGYDWVHGDDDSLFLRIAIMINRFLLNNLTRYEGDQRARVELILMGGLFEKPSQAFSRERAERLLIEWQRKLQQSSRHKRR